MFIDELIITSTKGEIRKIKFKMGLNLILDKTIEIEGVDNTTGNNVGKTTVLKLIEFCLGKSAYIVYRDDETKQDYEMVKEFLEQKEVLITLVLSSVLNIEDAKKIVIERNFLKGNKKVLSINGEKFTNITNFENRIKELLYPNLQANKPTLKQVFAHNFRHKDRRINHTLKYLDQNTTNIEYETLFLYLLGMPSADNSDKEQIKQLLKKEMNYKSKLEKKQTLQGYKTMLSSVLNEIDKYEKIKSELKIDDSYNVDLDLLNKVKYKINKVNARIVNLGIKLELTQRTVNELSNEKSEIDIKQIEKFYNEALSINPEITKKFEELVEFHNSMVSNKTEFYLEQKDNLEKSITEYRSQLDTLVAEENVLLEKTNKVFVQDNLETIIVKLTELYNQKGEYETFVSQIEESEVIIGKYADELDLINNNLQNDDFKGILDKRIFKFNEYYNSVSEILYGEKYYLKYDIKQDPKTSVDYYEFSTFNHNFGSGKKQGEIVSFDIAYILFARNHDLPTLEFICNDKKELMDIKQIETISHVIEDYRIQFIFSILHDKVKDLSNLEELRILELSQEDKLFRIESQNS